MLELICTRSATDLLRTRDRAYAVVGRPVENLLEIIP